MPQIWEMPTAALPMTGLERVPMNQGGGLDAAKNVPLLVSGPPYGGAVLVLDANMTADLSATADADPGAGKVRWNNADPHAATEIYVSDDDGDANDLAAAFAALGVGGFFYVQGSEDGDALSNLQRWQVTSKSAESGYTKLGVTVQASAGAFTDVDALWIIVQQPVPSPGVDRNVVTTVSSSSGTLTIDAALGDYFKSTLTENVATLSITNVPAACTLGFWVTQDSTPRTVAWPASFDWGKGTSAPAMPANSGDVLFVVITTNDAGGTWDASARVRA